MKIKVGNSTSQIEVPENAAKVFALLDNILRYERPGSAYACHKSTGQWKATYVHLLNKINWTFPTGLLDLVIHTLDSNGIPYEIVDGRIKPEFGVIHYRQFEKLPPLRYYQKEALENSLKEERGILHLATGTGKSILLYSLIKEIGLKSLILVPSVVILNQMHKQVKKYFGPQSVGVVGSGKKQTGKNITLGTPQSVLNYLEQCRDCDVLIVDEAHHGSAETIRTINKALSDTYYRFYSTATPFRNDGTDLELVGVIGSKELYTYTTDRAISDGFLVPPVFLIRPYIHENNGLESETWQEEQKRLCINNAKFNFQVASEAIQLAKEGRKVIVFVAEIAHGETLEKMIPNSVFVNGNKNKKQNQKDIEDFAEGKIEVLIATSVVGEGADLIMGDAMILASCGKAKSDVIQKIGRLLRPAEGKEFAIVVDFTHKNSVYLNRHYKMRHAIYKSYNTQIIEEE